LPCSGTLSVVVIARNQERTVGPLLESVFREAEGLPLREVTLVDSASTDRTVEVALARGAAVLQLPQADWLCASAGRFAGFAATSGESVLFLDGDMELLAGWLRPALRALEADPGLAAVTGLLIDSERGTAGPPTDPIGPLSVNGHPGWALPHPSGAALYRREGLQEAGGFNPYLRSDEEPELAHYLLSQTRLALTQGLAAYAPDGAWHEGPEYWSYATKYTVVALSALKSALGTDFGLSQKSGLAETGLFRLQTTGPTGLFFNFADSEEQAGDEPSLFWLGRRYNNSLLAWGGREAARGKCRKRRVERLDLVGPNLEGQRHEQRLRRCVAGGVGGDGCGLGGGSGRGNYSDRDGRADQRLGGDCGSCGTHWRRWLGEYAAAGGGGAARTRRARIGRGDGRVCEYGRCETQDGCDWRADGRAD